MHHSVSAIPRRRLVALFLRLSVAHVVALASPAAPDALIFSAGFSDYSILQRSNTVGAKLYGFAPTNKPISVQVSGTSSYKVSATVKPFVDPLEYHPDTSREIPHGNFTWEAILHPAAAGGDYTIVVTDGTTNGTATISHITFGDVWFCSGQSNMALETYYTFSADGLKAEVLVRHCCRMCAVVVPGLRASDSIHHCAKV